jgi:hypothetical protein
VAVDYTEEELIELYEERAAIMEHDGGLTRDRAEKAAYYDWRKQVGNVVVPAVIRDKARKFVREQYGRELD